MDHKRVHRPVTTIFISYRREDTAGHSGRLHDYLTRHFGEKRVFMDVETIGPGQNFVDAIKTAIGTCNVLVVVMGRQWLSNAEGTARRIDNPDDFVRLEIALALARSIRVIPVLVQGATMPRVQDLPAAIKELAQRNALEVSDRRWVYDVRQLVRAIEELSHEPRWRRVWGNKYARIATGLIATGLLSSLLYFSLLPTSAPAPAYVPIVLGDQGTNVLTMQKILQEAGYYAGHPDGQYGPATAAAVAQFQQENGLEPDGKLGAATITKIVGLRELKK